MPIDNVQRFERLCADAMFLQHLADKYDTDAHDEINSLTDELRRDVIYQFPVSITGGLVEVDAIDVNETEMNQTKMFVPNTGEVSGVYEGLSWKPSATKYPDGSVEAFWYLCHTVAGAPSQFVDGNGDKILRTPLTFVTVEGSEIDLVSPIGSHDYRKLALDGVCFLIDEIAMDEAISLDEKADSIAKFFSIPNAERRGQGFASLVRQRVSYLNEIGLFSNAVVVSPVAVDRNDPDEIKLLRASDNLYGEVGYLAIDEQVTVDGLWIDGLSALSYEVVLSQFGHLSIPHIPGVTKVYQKT